MPFILRPMEISDHGAVSDLGNAVYPNCPASYQEWKIMHETQTENRRYVVTDEEGGQITGYGCVWLIDQPNARLHLAVHPDRRNRGVGGLLYNRLMADLNGMPLVNVQSRVRETETGAIAFLQNRGFLPTQYMTGLSLPTAGADPAAFQPLLQRLQGQGITVTTLERERNEDPDCLRKLYDLRNAVFPDMPEANPDSYTPDRLHTPFNPPSFADFSRHLEEMNLLPDAYFIAKACDRYIGWTSLTSNAAEEGDIGVGDTGVLREFRRRGIAMSLKAKTIAYVKQTEYRHITTKTANEAMRVINEKLGFQRMEGEVRLLLVLPVAPQPLVKSIR